MERERAGGGGLKAIERCVCVCCGVAALSQCRKVGTRLLKPMMQRNKISNISANSKHGTQILRLVFIQKEFGKLMSSVTSYNIQDGRHSGYIWP